MGKKTSLKLFISLALILPTGCGPAVESLTSLQLMMTMPVVDNPTQVIEAGTVFDNQPVIDSKGFAINPQTVTITVGTQVTWTNSDSTAHTATASDLGFDSGLLKKGESFTFEFNTPGTYTLIYTPHSSMQVTLLSFSNTQSGCQCIPSDLQCFCIESWLLINHDCPANDIMTTSPGSQAAV